MKYFLPFLFFISIGCQQKAKQPISSTVNVLHLPTFTEDGILQAIVKNPVANEKMKHTQHHVQPSYFLNHGILPSTSINSSDPLNKGALRVVILAKKLASNSIEKIIPIGMLHHQKHGKSASTIVAVPVAKEKQVISAEDFDDFSLNYPELRKAIGNQLGSGAFKKWTGGSSALKEIEKHQVHTNNSVL